jgi:hypothetical protein
VTTKLGDKIQNNTIYICIFLISNMDDRNICDACIELCDLEGEKLQDYV